MAVRATQLVALTELAGEGRVVMPDFWGWVDGERVFVTAVLERTVVYVHGTERRLIRQSGCMVDPGEVEVRESTNPMSWRSRGKKPVKVVEPAAGPAEPEASDLDEEPEIEDVELEVEVGDNEEEEDEDD